MSQLLILLLYVFWLAAQPASTASLPIDGARLAMFLAGFCIIVAIAATAVRWATRLAVVHNPARLHRRIVRFMIACRLAVVGWFALGVLDGATWVEFVLRVTGTGHLPITLPGMLLGPMPALLAWAGLLWAQYPVDRVAREWSYGSLLESNLPVHAVPSLGAFLDAAVRMQLLATVVPLLLIALFRDAISLIVLASGVANPRQGGVEAAISIGAALLVLLIAPEALRRIFRTTRLPESALRSRLGDFSERARARYREVLLWHTGYAMGNAAVVGLAPQLRYVLLSDLLLETMTDREIEAAFAHELGHIVHRHTLWYLAFIAAVIVISIILEVLLRLAPFGWPQSAWQAHAAEYTFAGLMLTAIIVLFGMFSRRLERQADVYAARALSTNDDPRISAVGEAGAGALASALYRVAEVNHIPIHSRSFRHGSIARRVRFIQNIAADPHLTHQFDRSMRILFAAVLVALFGGGACLAWMLTYSTVAT